MPLPRLTTWAAAAALALAPLTVPTAASANETFYLSDPVADVQPHRTTVAKQKERSRRLVAKFAKFVDIDNVEAKPVNTELDGSAIRFIWNFGGLAPLAALEKARVHQVLSIYLSDNDASYRVLYDLSGDEPTKSVAADGTVRECGATISFRNGSASNPPSSTVAMDLTGSCFPGLGTASVMMTSEVTNRSLNRVPLTEDVAGRTAGLGCTECTDGFASLAINS